MGKFLQDLEAKSPWKMGKVLQLAKDSLENGQSTSRVGGKMSHENGQITSVGGKKSLKHGQKIHL